MLNEFLGTKLKIVSGYQGNSTMVVAMERGEVDGVTNSWDSWKSLNPAWLAEKKINLLVQTEPKAKDLDIPSVQDLARNDDDRQVIALIVSGRRASASRSPRRPTCRPSGCRRCAMPSMPPIKDPEFIKAAAAARIEINPIHGATLQSTVAKVLARPSISSTARKSIIVRVGRAGTTQWGTTPPRQRLKDLTVLDLTHARAGPVCVRQLGDWGANVIGSNGRAIRRTSLPATMPTSRTSTATSAASRSICAARKAAPSSIG